MLIQSLGYPTSIAYPSVFDGARYWELHFNDLTPGITLRIIDGNAVGPGFDNVFLTLNGTTSYIQEFDNPDQTVVLTGAATGSDVLRVSGAGSETVGNFTFRLQMETGVATGVFVNVATGIADFDIVTAGAPFIAASDYGGGDPLPECFWMDIVRGTQVCD